jgi:hypothetical protein
MSSLCGYTTQRERAYRAWRDAQQREGKDRVTLGITLLYLFFKINNARTLWAVKKSGFMECTLIIKYIFLKFEFKFHSSWKCERIFFI